MSSSIQRSDISPSLHSSPPATPCRATDPLSDALNILSPGDSLNTNPSSQLSTPIESRPVSEIGRPSSPPPNTTGGAIDNTSSMKPNSKAIDICCSGLTGIIIKNNENAEPTIESCDEASQKLTNILKINVEGEVFQMRRMAAELHSGYFKLALLPTSPWVENWTGTFDLAGFNPVTFRIFQSWVEEGMQMFLTT
ncbi:uncharacterized protein LY89DRAFT_727513 [Mollisia scopiformis]|uniref:Uncharacterized protein n=1 Tax=Mollisia scopiformis TaxID=149040 RepID=A0A194XW77_MOLSC|nr:uncharacterized protein LY89DRAFT_727513 [Mollisia scopiformis]KUJ24488.1 hypothetical protein LY89DRAFT_727513 [Mollisia scopiformis]